MKEKMNNKGQVNSIIFFIVIIAALLIFAPIALNGVRVTTNSLGDAFANKTFIGAPEASANAYYIKNKFVSLWDTVIIFVFLLNILLLFISAFLVQTHPAFVIIYILGAFFTFLIAPSFLKSIDAIYNSGVYATDINALPLTSFLAQNIVAILLGIIFVTGVIAYARLSSGGGNKY